MTGIERQLYEECIKIFPNLRVHLRDTSAI